MDYDFAEGFLVLQTKGDIPQTTAEIAKIKPAIPQVNSVLRIPKGEF
ncbi:hypothetical protein [Planococcus antarcticus]|nr:hypothetical protein [Planococcus antarcticus]